MRIDKHRFYEGTCKKCKNFENCKGSSMNACARTRMVKPESFEFLTGIKLTRKED